MSIKTKNLVIYIHGKGGSTSEAEHYARLFPEYDVTGFDYHSELPREASEEFPVIFDKVSAGYESVYVVANSIGAYFTMNSLNEKRIKKAFFISPILDMEKLIYDMMLMSDVTEKELEERKEIQTAFGETLSWDYLMWVKEHPISWNIPTEILYGGKDNLQSVETVNSFAKKIGANVTVMKNGEHWFHTDEQMKFSDNWFKSCF